MQSTALAGIKIFTPGFSQTALHSFGGLFLCTKNNFNLIAVSCKKIRLYTKPKVSENTGELKMRPAARP
jgi:hypothetical protein